MHRIFSPPKPIFSSPLNPYSRRSRSFSTPADFDKQISHLILQQQSPSKALQTFKWASHLPNFTHSQATFKALIQKLSMFRWFKTIKTILFQIPTSLGAPPDDDIFVTIIRGLGRSRMPRQAAEIPDLVSQFGVNPSLKVFNSVLNVLVVEDIDLARGFFRRKMMGSGVIGDEYTFGILMKGLCRTNRINEAFVLLSLMKSQGFTPNSIIYNTLIHALCRNGKLGRARSLMSEMSDPNAVTFNILISSYCHDGDLIRALVLLEQCFSCGLVPNVVAVTKLVEILCAKGRVTEAVEVLGRVEKRGGVVDTVSYNTLIKGFCQLGKLKVAKRVVKDMESKGCLPNASTYNALIEGFCESSKMDKALDLYDQMRIDGIEPDFVTYDTLIRGLCLGQMVEDGMKILEAMEHNQRLVGHRISPYNSIIYGLYKQNQLEKAHDFLASMERFFPRTVDRSFTILNLYEKCMFGEAKKVYDQMVKEGGCPSAIVYACLIEGLCKEGDICRAFELMNTMVVKTYFPLPATFNFLIRGFCTQGSVETAIELIGEVVRRGQLTDASSYCPLIEVFCKRGDLQRALSLLERMADKFVVPDHSIWNPLLLCVLRGESEWLNSENWLHSVCLFDCEILDDSKA